MKKISAESCVGRLCRAGVLLIGGIVLASCSTVSSVFLTPSYRLHEDISKWQAAGSPLVVSCEFPLKIKTPVSSGNMGAQAYSSIREFSKAAMAAQAPIWECGVIGGNAGTPDAAQIAGMGWGSFGYAFLNVWRPAMAFSYIDTPGYGNVPVLDNRDTQNRVYANLPS
jgi:hypothetical protein